jgi:ketosteroid isomerase-like protein
MRLRPWIVVLAVLVATPAFAQPVQHSANVPTVTRLVKLFSDLERGLAEKALAKDVSALDAMLDPSFEMRVGSAPGMPVPRDAWIRQARAGSHETPRIEQMAVHDFGDLAVVSFLERAGGAAKGRFVVDCWKRNGDAWKLAVRYVSDASAQDVKLPGNTVEKRY